MATRTLAGLGTERFVADWRALAAADPKLTLLQEPEFVLPWYRAYCATHSPLVLMGRSASGALSGLLPLALRRASGTLVHAGGNQAEYHGWLALPGTEEEFLVDALAALRRQVGFASWQWRWLPPGAGFMWTSAKALERAGIPATVRLTRGRDIEAACGQLAADPRADPAPRPGVPQASTTPL